MRVRVAQVAAGAACLVLSIAAAARGDLEPPRAGGAAGGLNDFSCRPTRTHPEPLVLLHGAGIEGVRDMAGLSWSAAGPALARDGYCVFAPNYGRYRGTWGRARVQTDAAQVERYVARVRRATRARRVSLVTHSAGGAVARYYLRFRGGARAVRDLVSLAPPNHVTRLKHSCPLLCTQLNGRALYRRLNRGGELQPGVDYTVIESRFDGAIVPYRAAFLRGPALHLTNVLVQRRCPDDHATHAELLFDPVALQWVESALRRHGPADPELKPRC